MALVPVPPSGFVMLNVALVGVAHIHYPNLAGLLNRREDVRVSLIWDADTQRASRRLNEFSGASLAPSVEVIAESDVNLAVVLTETRLHAEVVPALAQAKKALFVEKPIGRAAADAKIVADAIEAAGVLFNTGYYHRGDSKIRFLKEQITAGAFGTITRARMSNCHSGALGGWFDTEWRWMADREQAGVGAFGDLGTHVLDAMLYLLGPVETATARLGMGTARYPGCDETGEGLLAFTNGTIGTMTAAWDDIADPVKLQISGTEGHALIYNGELYFESRQVESSHLRTPATLSPNLPWGLEALLDSLIGKDAPTLVGIREAEYAVRVMEALYTGASTNTWISVT